MARSSTTRSLCTNKRTFFCASATPGFDRAPRGESARAEKRDVARESRSGPVLAPRGQVFFLSPPDNRYAQGSKCCLGPSTTTAWSCDEKAFSRFFTTKIRQASSGQNYQIPPKGGSIYLPKYGFISQRTLPPGPLALQVNEASKPIRRLKQRRATSREGARTPHGSALSPVISGQGRAQRETRGPPPHRPITATSLL